ncbi:MAG: hypothetical protein N2039_06690, partial [Gemmataceae bacterium]|nr:hypothetical protein [Gemmataceae bacterium]
MRDLAARRHGLVQPQTHQATGSVAGTIAGHHDRLLPQVTALGVTDRLFGPPHVKGETFFGDVPGI